MIQLLAICFLLLDGINTICLSVRLVRWHIEMKFMLNYAGFISVVYCRWIQEILYGWQRLLALVHFPF